MIKTPEQQEEAVKLANEWLVKHAHDEVEGTLAFHSFMAGHDAGFKVGRELAKEKLDYDYLIGARSLLLCLSDDLLKRRLNIERELNDAERFGDK